MIAAALTLAVASGAAAQTTSGQKPPAAGSQAATGQTAGEETRPATTTTMGDTGLWNVPTAEVLPAKRFSLSAYRVNFDDNQGFSDVSNWPVTFGVGIKDRAELFGALTVVNRVDRDIAPLFDASLPSAGGVVPQDPLATSGWSGSNIGDLYLGAKINFLSEWKQNPVSFALRPIIKIPTGSATNGAGTGKADFLLDAVLSKEIRERVELSGYGGFIVRGSPSEVQETNGIRWGFGAGMPTRKALRLTAELYGEKYTNTSLIQNAALTGADGSILPAGFASDVKSPAQFDLGLTWQAHSGFFAGVGWTWRVDMDSRSAFLSQFANGIGDKMDVVGRIGYHPGVRIYVPPAPPPPPPPPPAPPVHALSVKAQCDPCDVETGRTSTVSAVATDSIGCSVTYAWSAPGGSFTNPQGQSTPWTAPMQEGPVPVTVTVRCPSDNKTASDTVTVQVHKPPVKVYNFEDVHFDFDRYSLRPEALRTLDEAIRTLQDNPDLKIEIEGHTCNIGTAEYNLALGERRANAVRDYLVSRGVSADRLHTVSYGEERPKYDNSREETRRLNRRAALTVRVVQ
ncbi:MAG: OmpA family protein [Vicinamibacterales bacterium]